MLLEFSCSNYKSKKEKVFFSALAGTDITNINKTKDMGSYHVLRSAVIYGANGSGKSNFIDAILFVSSLVRNSIKHQPGEGIFQIPHKMLGFKEKSTFRIQFVKNEIRYIYGFSLDKMIVSDEYFYYFPKGKRTKIFERKNEIFKTGRNFTGKLERCKDVLKPNRLLLSCAANFSSVQEIEMAYRFFAEDIIIYRTEVQEQWMQYSLQQINSNKLMKQAVLELMNSLGTGIKDIKVKIDQKKLELSELPPFLSDDFKLQLSQGVTQAFSAKIVYDAFETDLFNEESVGIKKLFAFLCPFLDIMANGKVLICDELESGLHESLVHEMLKLFMNMELKRFPQLFIATHDTNLLSPELFRRDQIWFTELKGKERATDLFSLAEIKNVRKDENFEKGYISGRYGAIPMLNENFANIVSRL